MISTRCKDYPGIQFVKRLSNITNQTIQKAEVAAWFGQVNLPYRRQRSQPGLESNFTIQKVEVAAWFGQVTSLYLEVDRRNL